MDIIEEDLVEIDLNDDVSSYNENQFQANGHVNENEQIMEIPLIEYSNVTNENKEDDKVEYDKYGFKKSYKYISKKRQEEYEIYYQKILERREQKWNLLIEEHGGKFPPMSSKLKRFIRKGIPGYIRSYCWLYYSGAKEDMSNNKGLYVKLLNCEFVDKNKGLTKKDSKALDCIYCVEKDLFRTFPDNKYFEVDSSVLAMDTNENSMSPSEKYYVNPYIGSLRNILVAFVYYSLPKSDNGYEGTSYTIGYCQSLNYIAGLLLLIFSQNNENLFKSNATAIEEMCFWVFATLIGKILPKEMYGENGMEGAIIEQELLWNLIIAENGRKFGVKKVAKWKKDMEKKNNMMNGLDDVPESENLTKLGILTFKWMTTCFVGVLPIETVLRVWDCIFTEGSITILRVTLTLLRIYENDISKNDDELEGWDFINKLPYKIIDCHRFMEICFRPRFSINPLKNLYYSITLVNPMTQSELKKNGENGETSKQLTTLDADTIQQHEMQQKHQQQQLYQVLQNQNQENNQNNSYNNSYSISHSNSRNNSYYNNYSNSQCQIQNQDLNQDQYQQLFNTKNKYSHQRNKSFSFFLSIKNQSNNNNTCEKSNGSKHKLSLIHPSRHSQSNSNSNESSLKNSINTINDNDKNDDMKKHRRRFHRKSYSESTRENSYNYDPICSNNSFEGSFYNKISSALNRRFTNSKKKSNQKDSKKNNVEEVKKKSSFNKLSISNNDIIKKHLEHISNKKKNNDSSVTDNTKESKYSSKENINGSECKNNSNSIVKNEKSNTRLLSDSQLSNFNKNKNYYTELNKSIHSSMNFNDDENGNDNNGYISVSSSKSELNNEKDNMKNVCNNNNIDSKNKNGNTIKDKGIKSYSKKNDKDDNLIIVKPFCQISASNESIVDTLSLNSSYYETTFKDCFDSDGFTAYKNNSEKIKPNSKEKIKDKISKNKNHHSNNHSRKSNNKKSNGNLLSDSKICISSSSSNLSSNDDYLSSSNEKILSSSDDSLNKLNNNKRKNKVTTSNNKNNINNHNRNIPCSPSLSVISQSSMSSQSTDLSCTSDSSSMSDEDDDQYFFDIDEFSGTINGDLLKLNEENKIKLDSKDSNNKNSNEQRKASLMFLNNDIIIKTIEEKLKEKIIDKQQNFKYLDLLNGSKIGSNSISNKTRHKRNALSFQYFTTVNNDFHNEFLPNKYYSLNNLNRYTMQPPNGIDNVIKGGSNSNIQKRRHHSFDNSKRILDDNDEFHSFVDIYYQFNDKVVKVNNNNNNNNNNNLRDSNNNKTKISEKSLNKNLLLSPNNDKIHYTLDANGNIIDQNSNVKAKGPDVRVYCSNEINSPSCQSNQSEKTYKDKKIKESIYDTDKSNKNFVSRELNNKIDNKYTNDKQVLNVNINKGYNESLNSEINKNNNSNNNNNNNVDVIDNNMNKSSSSNTNRNDNNANNTNKCENDNELSSMSSSSNSDLMEQIQVFWRVTFPKNEGYHLVLRKGGIGNLSNKVINKYREKLWKKRMKGRKKE